MKMLKKAPQKLGYSSLVLLKNYEIVPLLGLFRGRNQPKMEEFLYRILENYSEEIEF